jgi:molecular chaperone DnaJ
VEPGMDDAYAELGLEPGASAAEVKAAWRRLASQWHPDRNRSAGAIARMQRINRALAAIRRRDDPDDADGGDTPDPGHAGQPEAGEAWRGEAEPGARTVDCSVELTLEEAFAGCIKHVRGTSIEPCPFCDGLGYRILPGACLPCGGAGIVRQRTWFGWFGLPVRCTACAGEGRVRQSCEACDGVGQQAPLQYDVRVRIPAGVRDGDLLHVGARRHAPGHPAVALNLRVGVLAHAFFELDADGTVRCTVPVNGFAWMANRPVDVPTLTGLRRLRPSRGELSCQLSGQGFPVERHGPRADQVVRLEPVFPERLGADQERLLDQLIAASWHPDDAPLAARLEDWRRTVQGWARARTRRGRPAAG